jgi:tetratricopeptide (TPR) repeat protein
MLKKLSTCLILIATWASVMATGTNHQASQLSKNARLKLADRYFAESLFYSAAENYQAYIAKKPTSRYANYWYAMSLYYAKDYTKSEKAFDRFYAFTPTKKDCKKRWEQEDKEDFKMGKFYYGLAQFRNGKYVEAKSSLSDFKSIYTSKDEKERATVYRILKQTQLSCDSVANISKSKVKIKALPKGVNHSYSETAPFSPKPGELYYTSTGSDTLMTFNNYKNEKYTSIYKATMNGRESGIKDKN